VWATVRINLTEGERERLETMSRSRALEGRLVLRARIVLLAAAGLSNRGIGEELGIDYKTAMRWRNRFGKDGFQGIEQERPGRGRNANVRGIVRLMLGLGLREQEALEARWEWVDLHRMTYTPGKTKGKEAVAIPLPKWLVAYLKKIPEHPASGYLFLAEDDQPHRKGYTRKAIERGGKVVGIAGQTHDQFTSSCLNPIRASSR